MSVRLAAHTAGRHGLPMREGQLPDAVVEALLIHGRGDAAVRLPARRLSRAMRRRIAAHPDPSIRDAHADFVRSMVAGGVGLGVDALVEAYGRPPADLAADPDPSVRAAIARGWHDRPTAVQELLLNDPDPDVRKRLDDDPALSVRYAARPSRASAGTREGLDRADGRPSADRPRRCRRRRRWVCRPPDRHADSSAA